MFGSDYYALVAGLKEYSLEGEHKSFDARLIIDEVLEQVSARDAEAVSLLYGYYDCENLASFRAGREAYNPLGTLSRDDIAEQMLQPERLSPNVAKVVAAYSTMSKGEESQQGLSFERELFAAYYKDCARSKSKFLREWSETDRNLRNVAAAISARAMGQPVESVVVGKGDVADQLRRSSAADFGLRGELDYLDGVIAAISDEPNLLEKEHKLDLVRWEQTLELTAFDYFNMSAVLAYLVRINIVARWQMLSPERGREMFDKLMQELSGKGLVDGKKEN